MKWFGESWGAPVCEPEDQVPIPVGDECMQCGTPIEEHERGFLIPYSSELGKEPQACPWHRYCFLASVGVATVHILHYGFPLCEFSNGTPATWPPNHVWVHLEQAPRASCPACKNRIPGRKEVSGTPA